MKMIDHKYSREDESWRQTIGAGLAMLCCVAAAIGVLILVGA